MESAERADAVPIGLGTALGLQVNSALADGIRYLTMGQDEARLLSVISGQDRRALGRILRRLREMHEVRT